MEFVILRSQTEPAPTPELPDQIQIKYFPIRNPDGGLFTINTEDETMALNFAKIRFPYLRYFLAVSPKHEYLILAEQLRAQHTGRKTPPTGIYAWRKGSRPASQNPANERGKRALG